MSGEQVSQTYRNTSPGRIATAVVLALLMAALALFGAVLPAEYGIDPLGTGELLGLLALSQVNPVGLESEEYRLDTAELRLGPGEWVEYSYWLNERAGMLFSWKATGVVNSNLHSAPDGAPAGYAESFDSREDTQAHGSYIAPFTGIHGWYWENLSGEYLTITLSTAGFYSDARETRDRVGGVHDLTDLRGNKISQRDEKEGNGR